MHQPPSFCASDSLNLLPRPRLPAPVRNPVLRPRRLTPVAVAPLRDPSLARFAEPEQACSPQMPLLPPVQIDRPSLPSHRPRCRRFERTTSPAGVRRSHRLVPAAQQPSPLLRVALQRVLHLEKLLCFESYSIVFTSLFFRLCSYLSARFKRVHSSTRGWLMNGISLIAVFWSIWFSRSITIFPSSLFKRSPACSGFKPLKILIIFW